MAGLAGGGKSKVNHPCRACNARTPAHIGPIVAFVWRVCACVLVNGIRCETWPEVGVKDTTAKGGPAASYNPSSTFLQNGALPHATVCAPKSGGCVCVCETYHFKSRFDSN